MAFGSICLRIAAFTYSSVRAWDVVVPPSVANDETVGHVVTPPAEEMETLHRNVLEGDMRKIIVLAEQMVTRDARYHPFTDQLQRLGKQYQSHAILKLIEAHLGSPTHADP